MLISSGGLSVSPTTHFTMPSVIVVGAVSMTNNSVELFLASLGMLPVVTIVSAGIGADVLGLSVRVGGRLLQCAQRCDGAYCLTGSLFHSFCRFDRPVEVSSLLEPDRYCCITVPDSCGSVVLNAEISCARSLLSVCPWFVSPCVFSAKRDACGIFNSGVGRAQDISDSGEAHSASDDHDASSIVGNSVAHELSDSNVGVSCGSSNNLDACGIADEGGFDDCDACSTFNNGDGACGSMLDDDRAHGVVGDWDGGASDESDACGIADNGGGRDGGILDNVMMYCFSANSVDHDG